MGDTGRGLLLEPHSTNQRDGTDWRNSNGRYRERVTPKSHTAQIKEMVQTTLLA